jgi:hypothetical protein
MLIGSETAPGFKDTTAGLKCWCGQVALTVAELPGGKKVGACADHPGGVRSLTKARSYHLDARQQAIRQEAVALRAQETDRHRARGRRR